MKTNQITKLCAMSMVACCFVSCMDDKYDLDKVDMTVGSNVDLWLPHFSTGSLELSSFMDLDQLGFVDTVFNEVVDDTIFYAQASGAFTITIPFIADGDVDFDEDAPPIYIASLPDIFKKEEVTLDLDNPVIVANVYSTVPRGQMALDFKISSYKNDKELSSCHVSGLTIKAPYSCFYAAAREEFLPAKILNPQYGTPNYLPLETGEKYSDLIKVIPDKLQTYVTRLSSSGFGMPVFQPSEIKVDLSVYAPLCVGKDFCIVYYTEETGWSEDLAEDIDEVLSDDLFSIALEALIDNQVALDAELEIVPIDVNGEEIVGLPKIYQEVTAKTNGVPLRYELKTKEGSGLSLLDYVKGTNNAPQLDGVKITCKLKANESHLGEYLRTKDFVKMRNIRLGVKGNIYYDAN